MGATYIAASISGSFLLTDSSALVGRLTGGLDVIGSLTPFIA